MSSYRSNGGHPVPPRRNRRNSIHGLFYNNNPRPRSVGMYNSNSNSINNPYSSSIPSSNYSIPNLTSGYSSPYLNYSNYNPYSSSSSPYSSSYGIGGSLMGNYSSPSSNAANVSSMLNSLNISKPLSSYALTVVTPNTASYNNTNNSKTNGRQSRATTRNSKYRDRSVSRPNDTSRAPSESSDMGARSLSLTSLESQGYVSGSEQSSGRTSRLDSVSDTSPSTPVRNENGEIDYKKLWEQSQADNERLRDKLRKQEDELRDTKSMLEKISTVTNKNSISITELEKREKKEMERKLSELEEELKTSKNSLSLSELEKREKRAMERKLSEMEEELKQLEALKVENQRLKDENGALIRVISKLSK